MSLFISSVMCSLAHRSKNGLRCGESVSRDGPHAHGASLLRVQTLARHCTGSSDGAEVSRDHGNMQLEAFMRSGRSRCLPEK